MPELIRFLESKLEKDYLVSTIGAGRVVLVSAASPAHSQQRHASTSDQHQAAAFRSAA